MLQIQGHTVSGISLEPTQKSLFKQAQLSDIFEHDLRIDIRNSEKLTEAVKTISPEVVIHLAAQALVRESYKDPVGTFETNVLGTLNILEATRELTGLKATLVVTTDKVYKNHNHPRSFVETDELGGDDPYSASKAAADMATQSWIKSFGTTPIAIARAGNVIGGGDWASDRIIPDLIASLESNTPLLLRFPNAVRPWQHVLDCLHGYTMLIQHQLLTGNSEVWNFGPRVEDLNSVQKLVSTFTAAWGLPDRNWDVDSNNPWRETDTLTLDSSKSRGQLGWRDILGFDESVNWTVEWYKDLNNHNTRDLTLKQINRYLSICN
jgi:CDP-glucose 4,6-dehydratase